MNLVAVPLLLSLFATGGASRLGHRIDSDTTVITVASYNIRHGSGLDGVVDLGRTAAAIRRLNADIVALEEVDNGVRRSGGIDEAAQLGELLGMHHAFGAFMPYQGGEYGLALLSRFPIVAAHPIRLPDGEEPRVALASSIELPSGDTITVFTVHFDWIGSDSSRYSQARVVADSFAAQPGPRIVLGDFNDTTGSRTLDPFHRVAIEVAKPPDQRFTFPADKPIKEIDFIFVAQASDWTTGPARVSAETAASDHRPVVATLRLHRE